MSHKYQVIYGKHSVDEWQDYQDFDSLEEARLYYGSVKEGKHDNGIYPATFGCILDVIADNIVEEFG